MYLNLLLIVSSDKQEFESDKREFKSDNSGSSLTLFLIHQIGQVATQKSAKLNFKPI